MPALERIRMPNERQAITHRFVLNGFKGYVTVGMLPDGRPGELFIRTAKAGSFEHGLFDVISILVSLCLQYGVPLEDLSKKFIGTSFEPSGIIDGRFYKSVVDYVFTWLSQKFNGELNESAE